MIIISFQTLEVLKEVSAQKDETWLFSAGVDQSLRFNHSKPRQEMILGLLADAECGLVNASTSLSEKSTSITNTFNSLLVLQDISPMILFCRHNEYDIDTMFFSNLSSLSTITDCFLRKLRVLLMVVSLECTKLELFEEGNFKSSPCKSKDKPSACGRRKKGRNRSMKRQNSLPKSAVDEQLFDKPSKVLIFSEDFLLTRNPFAFNYVIRENLSSRFIYLRILKVLWLIQRKLVQLSPIICLVYLMEKISAEENHL